MWWWHLQAKMLMAGAPFAAVTAEDLSPAKAITAFKQFRDKVYYGDIMPPVGSQQLSYAKFMELMHRQDDLLDLSIQFGQTLTIM